MILGPEAHRRRKKNACLAALERLRRRSDIGLNEAIAFLYICENEGINIQELSQLTGLSPSTTSRTVHRLTSQEAPHSFSPGSGLVLLQSQPADKRGRVVVLSPLGVELRDDLELIIADAHPIRTSALARQA